MFRVVDKINIIQLRINFSQYRRRVEEFLVKLHLTPYLPNFPYSLKQDCQSRITELRSSISAMKLKAAYVVDGEKMSRLLEPCREVIPNIACDV